MSEAPDLRAYDASIPRYDRTPHDRALRACLVKFVDAVGTHLICPRRACKRDRACADRDMRALPFCWEQNRGMLRFLLCVAEKQLGLGGQSSGAEGEEARMPEPFRGEPLLAQWAKAGAPIEKLARSAEDGPDDWNWESMPETRDLFRQLTGDERPPNVARD